MRDVDAPVDVPSCDHADEIERLHKVIRALMERAERSTNAQMSDFGQFQNSVLLEEQVHERTMALEAALHQNEKITRALRESEERFRGLVSQSMVGIVIVDADQLVYSNAKFNEIFGYTPEEVRELRPLDITLESDRDLVAEQFRRRLSGEVDHVEYTFRGRRKDGAIVELQCHGSVMESRGRPVLFSVIMDVTERCRAEREVLALQEQLREQSIHDPLTGLYNRRYLEGTLERALARATRKKAPLSVVMADLDHFKSVNDRLGHPAGDEVLRSFGRLMQSQFRSCDVCCRYGGEEFVVVLPDCSHDTGIDRAERLRRATEERVDQYAGETIHTTASFGVATFPDHGRTAADLIEAADAALYAAKSAGRNRVGVAIAGGPPRP